MPVEITFTHPRRSEATLVAEIDPLCTASQALAGLMEPGPGGPFLEPAETGRPYQLVLARTNAAMAPNQTFGDTGAKTGDVVDVRQRVQGA